MRLCGRVRRLASLARASAVALAIAWLALPGLSGPAAAAAEYPYSGYFTIRPWNGTDEQAQLKCAVNFFYQEADGDFASYHLDLEAMGEDRIEFVEYGRGFCKVLSDRRIEDCYTSFYPDPKVEGTHSIDVIERITADAVDVRFFATVDEARAFLEGSGEEPALDRYVRCEGFSAGSLRPYMTYRDTEMVPPAIDSILTPQFSETNMAVMRRVLEAIHAGPAESGQ